MDTLVIVRKIREAEALADSGKHGDARKLLEPLLRQDGLSDAHKNLLAKKIEVFDKQKERATRLISRRVSSVSSERSPSDDTDPGSGRKPSNDSTVERPALSPGAPTEALDRPAVDDKVDKDTTKLRKRPPAESPAKGDTTLADRDLVSLYDSPSSGSTTVRDRPAPARTTAPSGERNSEAGLRRVVERPPARENETEVPGKPRQVDTDVPSRGDSGRRQEAPANALRRASDLRLPVASDLAPLELPQEKTVMDDDTAEIPKISVVAPPVPRRPQSSQELAPVKDDKFESDEVAVPVADERGEHKALLPTPSAEPVKSAASVRVQDSYIDAPSPEMPATLLERAPSARRDEATSARSSKDLTSMADRLPDDDLRKELVREVVRLREELEQAKSGSTRRDTDRTGSAGSSRRIAPGEKPESSMFKIPSNRVNTIVRTAAGTNDITAHMPTRDENVPELEVMRRDRVKRSPEDQGPQSPSRVMLAQDYIDSAQVATPSFLKTAAIVLGFVVVAGLITWAVFWGFNAASAGEDPPESPRSPAKGN